MTGNGFEWTNDWYAEDYYEGSPVVNPQGPASGEKKIMRSSTNGNTEPALTFERYSDHPSIAEGGKYGTFEFNGFRCVDRSPG